MACGLHQGPARRARGNPVTTFRVDKTPADSRGPKPRPCKIFPIGSQDLSIGRQGDPTFHCA